MASEISLPDLLISIYEALFAYYGAQRWWPTHSGSRWEVALGSVLIQHTSWTNTERALQNVLSAWGSAGLAEPDRYLQAPIEELERLLRPAGFYTAKPGTVQVLARFVVEAGGMDALAASTESTADLRRKLLEIRGIGPETADAILLYALDRPVFVADAYALRLASRWSLLPPTATYHQVQALFTDNLPHDTALFNEYHALLVAHGKVLCRPRPRCHECPLYAGVVLRDGTRWRCPRRNVAV